MKNIFLFIILTIAFLRINAQQSSWQVSIDMNTSSSPTSNVVFTNGYLYLIGSAMGMDGTIFNSIGTTPDTIQEYGTYLAKYSTNGALIWTKRLGTNTFLYNLKAKNGFLYAAMYFSGTAEFNGTSYVSVTTGTEDIILFKLDLDGNFIWTKHLQGQYSDRVFDIYIDNNNDILMTGWFQSTLQFDTIQLNTNSSSNTDAFIAKFDSAGNTLWAQKFGSTGTDEGHGIATDINNNIVVTGRFSNIITNSLGSISSSGATDIFIIKLKPDGTLIWMKKAGGTNEDCGKEIKFDPAGQIVVAGFFYQNATFETIPATSNYQFDIFTAKYDTAGNPLWVKNGGGDLTTVEEPTSILFDNNSNIYISGTFCGSAHFGSLTSSSYGPTRMFMLKYSSSGSEMWLNAGPSTIYITSLGSTQDQNKGIYVVGKTVFGTSQFDTFLLKINDNTITSTDELSESSEELKFYPNPFNDILTVEAKQLCQVSLYSITGRLLQNIKTENDKLIIKTNELPAGIYIVQLQTKTKSFSKKLILEK